MNEEHMEKRTVKIRTMKGKIITLTISMENATHLYGTDKFGYYTVVRKVDIDDSEGVLND